MSRRVSLAPYVDGSDTDSLRFYLSAVVLSKLPEGTTIISVTSHGAGFSSKTARILTEQPDGSKKSYFVKIATGPAGLQMIRGEFESMTAIYCSLSSFTPKPIAWDSITSPESAHFFISDFHNLSEFHDLSEAFPDPVKFTTKLASLHRAGKSPKGMYGFDVPTYNDGLPQDNTWKPTWEEFFANKLRQLLKQEEKAQGADPTLSKLSTSLLDRVVPRLLRPLESDGRSIRPSLIHGNLWYGNASTDLNSGEPIIFGACSFWAHNEYELGCWRLVRSKFGRKYWTAYRDQFPVSQPEEDHDDRIALYSIAFNLHTSAISPGVSKFRNAVITEMERLIEKY